MTTSKSGRPTAAVAFHPGYSHAAVIAEAVARGAAEACAEVISTSVDSITGRTVLAAWPQGCL
ncbi:hypothetical protein [Streptomyces griseorubiginosus]|uniref:hypothetical protein n=1 Tax=Streptomyces griseorubiginosus TaxID=67304 RepID=UPI000B0DB384|nr:hypothetical protein [Streptomyces griseorubiginosus]